MENKTVNKSEANKIELGGKQISNEGKFFFLAEIGINHNGSIDTVKKLIDMAVTLGADAVKFQKRTPEICVPEHQRDVPRKTPWGTMSYLDYKKRMEFKEADYKEIDEYCKEKDIIWFASPWDLESFKFLEKFNVPAYKIASAKLTDRELLMKIKETKKPVILSIGGSTMDQARKAISLLEDSNPLVILHCNSAYPARDDELNLRVIPKLKEEFPNHIIGYSGHELGTDASCIAAALGARVIERHITLDREMWGTDHSASLDAEDIGKLIGNLNKLNDWLGDGIKRVSENEKGAIEKLRDVDTL
jgi:N-acetylneuraminate synthase